MALKAHRDLPIGADGSYFMNEVAEAGGVVVYDTSACGGVGLDNPKNVVKNPEAATDPVAGILMRNVIDEDPSKYCYNPYREDTYVGGKVPVARNCQWVTTNMIDPAVVATIVPGETAFLSENFGANGEGLVTNVDAGGASVVGEFLTCVEQVDEADPCDTSSCCVGYVRLKVKC